MGPFSLSPLFGVCSSLLLYHIIVFSLLLEALSSVYWFLPQVVFIFKHTFAVNITYRMLKCYRSQCVICSTVKKLNVLCCPEQIFGSKGCIASKRTVAVNRFGLYHLVGYNVDLKYMHMLFIMVNLIKSIASCT